MDLQSLIKTGDVREVKRALAVRMEEEQILPSSISSILGVSVSFVSKYKKKYLEEGILGLMLGYRGSKGYLSKEEKAAVISFIKESSAIDLQILIAHIQTRYGVTYKSEESYYRLLYLGGKSFHKTKKVNPKKNGSSGKKTRRDKRANRI